ncbi:SDR family oxidoreductase [Candidatus Villigracilis saccharophilus]|uniref:SDR family oxidoreductase n=1 Tax=Candidatus Villigracilis saccharophilus TaxID=3140684 RepID=UPI0031E82131
MVKSALDIYGQIDILFNNAGIGRWIGSRSIRWTAILPCWYRANLTALMQVTRTVLPHMLKRREGHIINMVSVAGLIASPLITLCRQQTRRASIHRCAASRSCAFGH